MRLNSYHWGPHRGPSTPFLHQGEGVLDHFLFLDPLGTLPLLIGAHISRRNKGGDFGTPLAHTPQAQQREALALYGVALYGHTRPFLFCGPQQG